jgi:Pvc16 N-terminal domain
MSDYLSLAAISATLQELTLQALADAVPGVTVRIGTPRVPGPGAGPEVSLYIYQLSPNLYNRNQDLPTRSGDGGLLRRPFIALDLHYLFTFFGEQDLVSERMVGKLASYFNASPVLSPDMIRRTIRPNGSFPYLDGCNLSDSPDAITLTPDFPTLEELSKLWTVFFQMTHRISLFYIVGPLLVEAALPTEPPPPAVTNRRVSARPTPHPAKEHR